MLRSAATLAVLALAALPDVALAQPPQAETFRIVDAKIEKGKLVWSEIRFSPVEKVVEVDVVIDGKTVKRPVKVIAYTALLTMKAEELGKVKVTDAAGKAIPADKLADRLKEPTPVVIATAPFTAEQRKLFKDTTLFVQVPVPAPAGLEPGPVPE